MRLTAITALWLTGGLLSASPARAQDDWSRADQDIRRLTPAAFHKLPANVVSALEAKRCTVPQPSSDTIPVNAVRGSFEKKGRTDWAVLCSRAHASTIVIVWGGAASCPDEMEVQEDRSFLQRGAGGKIVFSRKIELATADYIMKMYQRFGGTEPPPLDHQGINDIFEGKGTTIRYCHEGRWLELTGDQTGAP